MVVEVDFVVVDDDVAVVGGGDDNVVGRKDVVADEVMIGRLKFTL